MSELNELESFAEKIRPKATINSTLSGASKVDPFFQEDPVVARLIKYCIKKGKNAYIWGHTGCGKSQIAIQVAAKLGIRLVPFNCHTETSPDNLIGTITRNEKGALTVLYGAAVQAYKEGYGLLLEEIDHANADILAALHRILETNSDYYVMNILGEELVNKRKGFFCLATANTPGTGEGTYLYPGTKPLNSAFMNRFPVKLKMDYMKPALEAEVLMKKTGVEQVYAKAMVDFATTARSALLATTASSSIATPISTRDLLSWAELIVEGEDFKGAAEIAFLNCVNSGDREVLGRFVENAYRVI